MATRSIRDLRPPRTRAEATRIAGGAGGRGGITVPSFMPPSTPSFATWALVFRPTPKRDWWPPWTLPWMRRTFARRSPPGGVPACAGSPRGSRWPSATAASALASRTSRPRRMAPGPFLERAPSPSPAAPTVSSAGSTAALQSSTTRPARRLPPRTSRRAWRPNSRSRRPWRWTAPSARRAAGAACELTYWHLTGGFHTGRSQLPVPRRQSPHRGGGRDGSRQDRRPCRSLRQPRSPLSIATASRPGTTFFRLHPTRPRRRVGCARRG